MSEDLKREAARAALGYVKDGMKLGLGTGSTAKHFVDLLAEKVQGGMRVIGVPTSEETAKQARELGVPLSTLEETPHLDITIDGADEVDGQLRLIKGGGGALLREKIVAEASDQMIVIADISKKVASLGQFPLPVEVMPFGLAATLGQVTTIAKAHGCLGDIVLRERDGKTFVTDGGHYILDCAFGVIAKPQALHMALLQVPGVVETGLFNTQASRVIFATPNGVEDVSR
jgi:ribose 5-phosphate isomerase A